ncbi:hypothetical protein BVRB_020490 [Beta vulgaris subsp. vulgaris]|uniref:PLOD1-3-like GT domain-containing protein n=1 Tax=Beta vulgaris subsp. vulgaris TaxID=3555 RepID=A0A0J8DUQ3_BETVV|nr:hypothetical protein BVRB_020490 [Beta vulgaris subsp. vulgaris]
MKPIMKRYCLTPLRAIIALVIFFLTFTTTTLFYIIQFEVRQDKDILSAAVPRQPALTLLTFASHQADFLCRLLTSAVLNGISVKVLGYDNNRKDPLFRKVTMTLAELKKRQPDEIIMFVDAFDVVIVIEIVLSIDILFDCFKTGNAETIVSEFLQTKSDVVFAAEKGCWPFMDGRPEGEYICQQKYPESPTPYRNLFSLLCFSMFETFIYF